MKVIAAIVGSVLIFAAVILSFVASGEESVIEQQNALVTKYVEESRSALEGGEIQEAIRYAKMAIAVDPKSAIAFKSYESALEARYRPAESEEPMDSMEPQEESPAEEAFEAAPDMGC